MPLLLWRPQLPTPLPPAAAAVPPAGPLPQPPADGEAPSDRERAQHLPLAPEQRPITRPGLQLPPLRRLEGLALLLITALMWGTYAPCLRLIYSLPGPPSPAVVAAARGTLQLGALLAALLASLCGCASRVNNSSASGSLQGQQPCRHLQQHEQQRHPAADPDAASKQERSSPSDSTGHSGTAAAAATAAQEPAGPEAAALADLEQPLLPKAGSMREGVSSAAAARDTAADITAVAITAAAAAPSLSAATSTDPEQPAEVVVEEGQRLQRLPLRPLGLPPAVLAALELGLYNTTGTLAQAWGLEMTTAARGAFLIQASTLFTPLLAAATGMAPSRQTVLGSLAALAGTLVIAADRTSLNVHSRAAGQLPASTRLQLPLPASGGFGAAWWAAGSAAAADHARQAAGAATAAEAARQAARAAGQAAAAAQPATSLLGDGLTIFAALCYSASTVRIPAWAVHRGVPSLHLALGKSAVLAAVSAAALAVQAWHLAATDQAAEELWPGWRQSAAGWWLILWSALGPGALGAFLHVKGQTLVSPTTAQVVFCSVPLWSALLAAALLPSEPLGPLTLLGGGLIAAGGAAAVLPASWRRS